MTAAYGLIADIGGTNARFALARLAPTRSGELLDGLDSTHIVEEQTLSTRDFPTFEAALEEYLKTLDEQFERPRQGCLAVACPTDQDTIRLTNNDWQFSVKAVQRRFGFKQLRFINDYHALASALPYLGSEETVSIGAGRACAGGPMVVTGPGTGLGLASLIFGGGRPLAVQSEAGHAHFAPTDETEMEVLAFLLRELPRVSWERLLSGMGLENLYRALQSIQGQTGPALSAPEITAGAGRGDALCAITLNRFCAMLGNYAGDVALMHGASGGIFLAGGILPRVLESLQASAFRARFEAKARLGEYTRAIPTRVITARQPGLLGAAAELNYQYQQHQSGV